MPYLTEKRVCRISLPKKVVGSGIFIWWDRLFKGDDKIDISKIDRGSVSASSKQFQSNWEEAHKQFQQYTSALEPTEIDCGGVAPDELDMSAVIKEED